jgi:hypothetical protein
MLCDALEDEPKPASSTTNIVSTNFNVKRNHGYGKMRRRKGEAKRSEDGCL